MISKLENLQQVFSKMDSNGWDTKTNLKWGFFFVDNNKKRLELVYDELKEKGYLISGLYLSDDKNWTLNVSKIECLTPEKLQKRNIAFNELAE